MTKQPPNIHGLAELAAASLQVQAARQHGLELDHRSILRRHQPRAAQAPLKTINPCRCSTCLRIAATDP